MIADSVLDSRPAVEPRKVSFLSALTAFVFTVGLASAGWAMIGSLGPSAEVTTPLWVDLSDVPPGHRKTVYWGDLPIFIAHRTPEEIAEARMHDEPYLDKPFLPFGEFDKDRVKRDEWVIVVGQRGYIGPFFGRCALSGQQPDEHRGLYGGWYNPCTRSSFDTSGRARNWDRGWNLWIPPYEFSGDTEIEFPFQR